MTTSHLTPSSDSDTHQPDPIRSVHIDYLTLSIPNEHQAKAEQWCQKHFGPGESGKGARFLSQSLRYATNAASLFSDPPSHPKRKPSFILDIPGAGCQLVGDDALVEFAMHARTNWGAHLTRLDIAVDMIGGVESLMQQVEDSCMNGEGCRFRYFRPTQAFSGGKLTGRTLDLGKRGKDGSGRMVCLYDKGLETKQLPAGQWVRWEARFYDECADAALDRYETATERSRILVAFDAVEFRHNASGQTHVDRRTPCEWWIKLRQSIEPPFIIRRLRQASTASGMVLWIGKQVAPTLEQIRRKLNTSWDDLMAILANPSKIPSRPLSAHAKQLCCELVDGCVDNDGVHHPSIYEMLWNNTAAHPDGYFV